MKCILVVNAGSSSVKFQVFALEGPEGLEPFIRGEMDGIGSRPRLRARDKHDAALVDQTFSLENVPDVATAMRAAGNWLLETQKLEIAAVGHRVVHGGPKYDRPIVIDDQVLEDLARYSPLAPLHQPNNLAPIRSIRGRFPQMPQVACFDTAFHRSHDPVADPLEICRRRVDRLDDVTDVVDRAEHRGRSHAVASGACGDTATNCVNGVVTDSTPSA